MTHDHTAESRCRQVIHLPADGTMPGHGSGDRSHDRPSRFVADGSTFALSTRLRFFPVGRFSHRFFAAFTNRSLPHPAPSVVLYLAHLQPKNGPVRRRDPTRLAWPWPLRPQVALQGDRAR